ncbi:MAG: cytidylate kinase [Promethearchaeota archaeon]|nr:MAG: cytidylate kinase [Candidatus Lokiarchaeota archaeon]
MIISLAGLHGTGKSTIARRLAKTLGYAYYSTGMAFRELAKEQNFSLEEFSKTAEQDDTIDHQIDYKIVDLAKTKGNFVFEGQLPTYMIEEWRDFAILLTCQEDVRIRRMMERDSRDFETQKHETLVREESEKQRFIDLYQIDIKDPARILNTFNLIIDTTYLDIDTIFNMCLSAVQNLRGNIP